MTRKRRTAPVPALFKVESATVAALGPGAVSVAHVVAFVAAADQHSPAPFMREQLARITATITAVLASRGASVEAKALAARCEASAAAVSRYMAMPAVTGDGIGAVAAAAFALGDDWASLQVVASGIPADVHAGVEVQAARRTARRAGGKSMADHADDDARKAFADWQTAADRTLIGKDAAARVRAFVRNGPGGRRVKDRVKALHAAGRLALE